MAIFHPHRVNCVCGHTFTAELADSINVKRSPDAREQILRGELHRATCPSCSRKMTVEKPFYYTDLERNALFKVLPRGERHTWKQASRDLETASGYLPASISDPKTRRLRVVFGMDELREKLVAEDAGLDDRFVELLKVLLVYEHPILLKQPRLRLTLDKVTPDEVQFGAAYEHDSRRFRLQMPRRIADDLAQDSNRLVEWTRQAHTTGLYDVKDHWVNLWRFSPQPSALDRLKSFAHDATAGTTIDVTSQAFQQMLSGLPRGTHLPGWAKQDLRTLFDYAKKHNHQKVEDKLFEIRFGFELENDWATNDDKTDIDTLWKLLRALPDSNVEGNTKIHELLLNEGEGGGVYGPSSHDIAIGSVELGNREGFEDVVRHEVGHAVHEMKDALVTGWLKERFGWRIFGTSDADIDQWVAQLGGWGSLSEHQRNQVRDALRKAVGPGGSWQPGPTPVLPSSHPWYGAHFGPRLAFEKTGSYWYSHFKTWHRRNGKAFFLNYWYRTFMVVDASTLDLVEKMPSSYAAMSHFEFFAELYALRYDLDDPKRSVIPEAVAAWLDAKIGAASANPAMPAAPAPKAEWETTKRPAKV